MKDKHLANNIPTQTLPLLQLAAHEIAPKPKPSFKNTPRFASQSHLKHTSDSNERTAMSPSRSPTTFHILIKHPLLNKANDSSDDNETEIQKGMEIIKQKEE